MHRIVRIVTGLGSGLLRTAGIVLPLVWHAPAMAAEPSAAPQFVIEQPSQALSDSLRAIARQTGISVLFDPAAVGGRMSRAVSGQLTAAEAISRALDGSGLVADVMEDGAIVVRPDTAGNGNQPARAPAVQTSAAAAEPDETTSDGAAPGLVRTPSRAERANTALPEGKSAQAVPEKIEVTGSRLKRIEGEGPLPVNTYTREDIDKSGQPTLERFLGTLNEASVSPGEGANGATLGQGSVQLRGLPLGSTLVLINGRRVQAVGSSSANFFNLNLIPLAAVDRVEVVPVGSSAVYGGDALAGVVNIILKKSIDGVSLDARLASGKGVGDRSLSLATGGSDDRGAYLLLGSYSKSTPLTMAERDFFKDADYRRFGGPDARTRGCTPGTVSSTTGGDLPGLGSSFAGIPSAGANEPLSIASFAASSGQANLCNPLASGQGSTLVYGDESFALHASGERRIGSAWTVFGELTFADDRLSSQETGLSLNNVLVPASNPYNPFGAPVNVTAILGPENGARGFVRRTRFTRALLGLRGELGTDWDFEATAATSRDTGDRLDVNSNADPAARDAALAASTPADALNPFTAGRAASDDVLNGIWSDGLRESRGRKDQLNAFVRGSVYELPAGPLEAIVGAEYARDHYETSIPGDISVLDNRNASAVYAEMRAPLLRAEAPAGHGWSLAALTVAGRRDRYSDFGSAGTYQAGLELRPVRTVLFRASAATSFKPPTMLQTSVDEASFPAELFGLVDPARNNEPITSGEVVRATNHGLAPEKGKAYALGGVWEPDGGAGTRLGLTAWRVKIDGLIAILLPQVALDHEALFPGFVTRGPSAGGLPGPVTSVLYSEVNYGGVDTSGVDVEAAHSWKTTAGRWTLGASATRTSKYQVVLAPDTPAEDRLGRRFSDYWSPRWKGRLSAALDHGGWSVGITSRYIGGYSDEGSSERRLGDYWIHDLAGSLDLKALGVGLGDAVKAASLSLSIANVTDRQPQFTESFPYYDVTQADWRGRYASVRLSVAW